MGGKEEDRYGCSSTVDNVRSMEGGSKNEIEGMKKMKCEEE